MKIYITAKGLLIFLFFSFSAFGQKHDYVWMFGYNSNATSEYPRIEGVKMNFEDNIVTVQFVIYDITGKIHLERTLEAGETFFQIHISQLPAGIYYGSLKGKDSVSEAQKLIIIR